MRFFAVVECAADDKVFLFGFEDTACFDCGFAVVPWAGVLVLLCAVAGHTNAPARRNAKKNL
jgi:hypothetical protein